MPLSSDELAFRGVQCAMAANRLTGIDEQIMVLRAQCYMAAAYGELLPNAAKHAPSGESNDHRGHN